MKPNLSSGVKPSSSSFASAPANATVVLGVALLGLAKIHIVYPPTAAPSVLAGPSLT